MTEDEVLAQLAPCPFCGAGETRVDTHYTSPKMNAPGSLISVVIHHWCPPLTAGAHWHHIEVRARDFEPAIHQWNTRK